MPRFVTPLYVLLCVSTVIGCDTVEFSHPVGFPVTEIDNEIVEADDLSRFLDGVWTGSIVDQGVVHVEYLGESRLRAAVTQWDEGQAENETTYLGYLTAHEDAYYLHLREEEEEEEEGRGGYLILRLLPADADAVILLLANPTHFAEAVDAGAITGNISGESPGRAIRVTGTKNEIDALIKQDEVGVQFIVGAPLLFRRVVPQQIPMPDDE